MRIPLGVNLRFDTISNPLLCTESSLETLNMRMQGLHPHFWRNSHVQSFVQHLGPQAGGVGQFGHGFGASGLCTPARRGAAGGGVLSCRLSTGLWPGLRPWPCACARAHGHIAATPACLSSTSTTPGGVPARAAPGAVSPCAATCAVPARAPASAVPATRAQQSCTPASSSMAFGSSCRSRGTGWPWRCQARA
jgi:hypothetical protein